MNNLKIITAENADKLTLYEDELVEVYKVAFAGPPWFEVSRCDTDDCSTQLTALDVGSDCPACGSCLGKAYRKDELLDEWWGQLLMKNAFMEVILLDGRAQRATLARPTTPDELRYRKYWNVPEMERPIKNLLPTAFVWIEDTFADRTRQATGNLKNRGQTLDRIAQYYEGAVIATRTLAEQVVGATLRDKRENTAVYIGTQGVGRAIVSRTTMVPEPELPTVPDARTLLIIKNS